MDQTQNTIAELLAVTRELASLQQSDGMFFEQLLTRRGELIACLCSGNFDPSDARIAAIVRDGAAILAKARSRRDSLREEAASLDLLRVFCGGLKSTLPQQREPSAVDVTA